MYVRLSLALSIAVSVTTALVATNVPSSASAQRWHELVKTDREEISLDLESLRWDGSKVTYQTLIKKAPPGSEEKRTLISTSTIDCDTQKRKHLAIESQLPDGSFRKISVHREWEYFPPTSLIGEIRQIVCAKKP